MEIVEDIISVICEVWGVRESEVMSSDRSQPLPLVRCMIAHELRKRFRLSTTHIGKILRKDHSTIMYYFGMFEQEKKQNASFRTLAELVASKIEQIEYV